jgi:hypothetical protein
MDANFQPVVNKGVPKSKMGVGFGWDTDNEITDPNDILAKCRYAIDKGYGGIMAWDITSATSTTPWILDSIARYVTHSVTNARAPFQMQIVNNANLFVKNNRFTGVNEVLYTVPPDAEGALVDLGVYDIKGALVKTVACGRRVPGEYSVVLAPGFGAGHYVVKLSEDSRVTAARALIVR